jgi:hypothetical protein
VMLTFFCCNRALLAARPPSLAWPSFSTWQALTWTRRTARVSLRRHGMVSQCATAALLFGVGDVLAQQLVEGDTAGHDWVRTWQQTAYGGEHEYPYAPNPVLLIYIQGILFAPVVASWYQFLNGLRFRTPRRAVLARTVLDQFAFAPGTPHHLNCIIKDVKLSASALRFVLSHDVGARRREL